MPIGFDIHIKTAQEAIKLIEQGNVKKISLDHDLGEPENGTGYDVAKKIEMLAFFGKIQPIEWAIHSANPIGRQNMQKAMENAEKYWNK